MAFNQQLFIKKAKEKGYSDNEINAYLQKNIGTNIPQQEEPKASGGFLGYVAPVLSTLPQVFGLAFGAREISKMNESELNVQRQQSDLAMSIIDKMKNETDLSKKETLRKQLLDITNSMTERGARMSELSSGKGLTKATELKLMGGNLLDAPGISTDLGRATQQISGRSISQLGSGASQILGGTAAGAVIGAGRGIEAGKSPAGVVAESAKTALLFKLTGFGFDKLSKTDLGKSVLTSPVGSTVLSIGNKVFSPFMATPSTTGTANTLVEQQFKKFGNAVDKLYSPSTYIKPTEKVLTKIGENIGLVKSPEERLKIATKNVEKFWQGYKDGYKSLVKYDKNSPAILAREGIGATQSGNSLITTAQQDVLKMKIGSEHSLLNSTLKQSGLYADVNQYKKMVENSIIKNTQAGEQVKALSHFRKEWQAYLNQNKGQIFNNKMPIDILNNFKSYSWSEGYSSKVAPKIDSINAKAMRLAGNSAKNYINGIAKKESAELSDAIIGLNERSSELSQALKFLESMNGNKVAFGKIGRHFARVVGAIVGSSGGTLSSIGGTMTADQVVSMLQNPNITIGKAMVIIQQLKQTNPQIVEQALSYLKNQAAVRMATKTLPSPTTIYAGPAGGGGTFNYPFDKGMPQ
jgi:hypothetical protein